MKCDRGRCSAQKVLLRVMAFHLSQKCDRKSLRAICKIEQRDGTFRFTQRNISDRSIYKQIAQLDTEALISVETFLAKP